MKRLVAVFYRTSAGSEPVRDWLLDLDAADRRIVGTDLATVEFGWPIGMPVCRSLGDGLWEIRSTIQAGRVEARVYVSIDNGDLVLLHGRTGKNRQQDDIGHARARLVDYRRRKGH